MQSPKDLVNQKNLDDYYEILDLPTVLDILDSMLMDEVRRIIESGQLFERSSNFTRICNHLMALLVACNGQRASAIRQMNHKAVMRASVGQDHRRTITDLLEHTGLPILASSQNFILF